MEQTMQYPYGVPFPVSVVGSLPRPAFVRNLIEKPSPPSEEDARHLDSAIQFAVAMQEHAGLDFVTDGEWRRRSYIGVIAEMAHGFELGVNPADGRPWTTVTGRLSPKGSGFAAAEAAFLKKITRRRIKVALPSPALLGERLWDAEKSAKAYPRREDFIRDCVPILRREVGLLCQAGADIIQIDDPHLCLFVDPEVRCRSENPGRDADFTVDMLNALVEGFRGPVFAVHLCRRAGARARGEACYSGGYDAILPQINRLHYQHLTLEAATPQAKGLKFLRHLREDFEIGLGCLGTEPGKPDSVDEIVARAERSLSYVTPERIVLNPDCGFAPGSGAKVDLDEVYAKLRNMVQAAQVLRARFPA